MKFSITSDGKKITLRSALYWILGTVLCCLGVSLCTKGGLGLSMIGAGPYILHVWLRDALPWFTQGTAEYVWEAIILIIMCIIIRRFRVRYLLSFGTAVIAGLTIDAWLFILGGNGLYSSLIARILAFSSGTVITALAIACFFRTTLPLQVYELAVTEIADKYSFKKDKVKLANDIIMLIVALAMALGLTKALTGIGIGTIIITFVNAPLISLFGKLIDRVEAKLPVGAGQDTAADSQPADKE